MVYAILEVDGVASNAVIPLISIVESVSLIMRSYAIDIVVLDGLRDEMKPLYVEINRQRRAGMKLIGCSSYKSAGFSDEELSHLNICHIPVWSWTQSDYASALALQMFGAEVTAELLEEAVFYGGGSIRAVLGVLRNKEQHIQLLDYAVEEVTNFEVLLGGLGGIRAPTAVNSLIQMSEDKSCTLLSEYIAKKISDKCANSFVVEARSVCQDNPAWQGWVHEIDFIARVKQCRKEKKPFVLERVRWSRSLPFLCRQKSFTINIVKESPVRQVKREVSGTFYIPQKWTHGCYDGVYYLLSDDAIHHFWFFQCTISSTHSYLFQHVAQFLHASAPLNNERSLRSNANLIQRDRPDVRVHFYVVGTKESAKEFAVRSCDIDGIESVQNFDPTFSKSSIKVVYLQNV
jgi:hypothetical protein